LIDLGTDTTGEHGVIAAEWAVTGDVGHVAGYHDRLVDTSRLGGGWQLKVQFSESLFGTHGFAGSSAEGILWMA
jgi:hypothetical protein